MKKSEQLLDLAWRGQRLVEDLNLEMPDEALNIAVVVQTIIARAKHEARKEVTERIERLTLPTQFKLFKDEELLDG